MPDQDTQEGEHVFDVDAGKKIKTTWATRGPSWKQEEDIVSCEFWMPISLDHIIDAQQTCGSYCQRIHKEFSERESYESYEKIVMDRNESVMSHRWGAIQEKCNKFCVL